MNSVRLKGRLARPAMMSYTKNGKAKALFTLACDRTFVNQQGEGKKQTSFISCCAWEDLAEKVAGLQKGDIVAIDGYVRTDSYEKDGERVYTTQIYADIVMTNEGGEQTPSNFESFGNEDTQPSMQASNTGNIPF